MDVEINIGQNLWNLMLMTVVFLAVFVTVQTLLPSEIKWSFKDYEEYYYSQDLRGSDMTIFNNSAYVNLTTNSEQSLTISGLDIRVQWQKYSWTNYIYFSHITDSFFGMVWGQHTLKNPHDKAIIDKNELLFFYENLTDNSKFDVRCDHVTLRIMVTSNNLSKTLPEAFLSGSELRINYYFQINVANMGANIWSILGSIFTFQAIETNVLYLDYLLNCLISIPVWVSVGFILYKLIVGIIPTVSGGGGS